MSAKAIVNLKELPVSRHHRPLKFWTKVLDSVDTSKSNGYCFEGNFTGNPGRSRYDDDYVELPVGSILLHFWEDGSRRYAHANVTLVRVEPDGSFTELGRWEDMPLRGWALACRDEIAAMLAEQEGDSELEERITEAIALLRAHGYRVTKEDA